MSIMSTTMLIIKKAMNVGLEFCNIDIADQ